MKLVEEHRHQVLSYVEGVPWGDVEGALKEGDEALRALLRMTRDDFLRWETEFEVAGVDEGLLATRAAALPADARFALVARLIRNVALMYGMTTEFGGVAGKVCERPEHASSAARRLLAIVDSQIASERSGA